MNRRDAIISVSAAAVIAASPALAHRASGEPDAVVHSVPFAPYDTLITRLHEWVIDQELDGKDDPIIMSRAAFKYCRLHNYIDYCSAVGDHSDHAKKSPHFGGRLVKVPGSAHA